jgi:hypothetical protein
MWQFTKKNLFENIKKSKWIEQKCQEVLATKIFLTNVK